MLHKNTLFGIIAAIVYAQSALGVASMQTASDTNQAGQASTLSRAGSLRTSTTRTISTGPKASVSGTNETNSARLTSSAGGINAVGTKANKLTKSTAATGAALTELERRIDDLSATKADESYVKNYVDVYDRETVDSKLAGKIDRGADFEQAFDARFGTKSIPSVTAVSNLDTRLATAEDKINTIEHNPGTDEYTVKGLIDSAVSNKKLVNEDYVSSAVATAKTGAVNDAKTYADDKFATKTALNDYDTSAQTTAKIQAATEGLATTGYVTEQIGKIEIPEEANLSEYYKAQQVDALLANKLNNNALDNYDTSAETSGKIQTAIAGLASQTYASEQASNALTSAKDYADSKITGLASQTYASEQASAALEAAKDYADSKITGTGEVDLSDYYPKDETYNKTEINSAIADAKDNVKAYADSKIQTATAGLASESFASSQANAALEAAKNYADGKVTDFASDLNNYYNKTEVDQKIVAASNGMSEEQVQQMIGSAVNSAIGNNYYDKEETDTLLAAKANASSVYTKTQADATFATKEENDSWSTAFMLMGEQISGKASVSDVYTKTQADATFATKEENATNLQAAKAYADTKVADLATENFAIEKAAAAYDSAKDYADENFAPKSALSAKADASTVNALTERVGSAESDISALQSSLDGKADKTTVNTLTGRVNSAESNITTLQEGLSNVYTKSEADATTATLRSEIVAASTGMDEDAVARMISNAIGDNYYTKTAADGKFATFTTLNSYSNTTAMNSAINSAVANLATKSELESLQQTVTSGLNSRPTTEQITQIVNGAQLCDGTIRVSTEEGESSTTYIVNCDSREN